MNNPLYLVSVRMFSDTYYRFAMAKSMLNTIEMDNLRNLAHKKGFRVDCELLDSIEDAEQFLDQFEVKS